MKKLISLLTVLLAVVSASAQMSLDSLPMTNSVAVGDAVTVSTSPGQANGHSFNMTLGDFLKSLTNLPSWPSGAPAGVVTNGQETITAGQELHANVAVTAPTVLGGQVVSTGSGFNGAGTNITSLLGTAIVSGTLGTNAANVAQWNPFIKQAGDFVSVLDFNAVGDGVTDDTAAFQAALASGKPVFVPPGKTNGYVISNLILSNNTLFSTGAKLVSKAGSTGYMIQFAPIATYPTYVGISNSWHHNKLIGLELDGGGSTNIPAVLGARHAVFADAYGPGNALLDCYIHSFSGYGVLASSSKPQASVAPFLTTDQGKIQISGVTVEYCHTGFRFASGDVFGDSNVFLCEYISPSRITAMYNNVGVWVNAGNLVFEGGNFSRNTNGVILYATQNDGHGSMVGCTINHNSFGIRATNISNGFVFEGCHNFFGTNIFYHCAGINFENGQSAATTFICDGGGVNYIRHNRGLGTQPTPVFSFINGDSSLEYDNISPNGTTGSTIGPVPWVSALHLSQADQNFNSVVQFVNASYPGGNAKWGAAKFPANQNGYLIFNIPHGMGWTNISYDLTFMGAAGMTNMQITLSLYSDTYRPGAMSRSQTSSFVTGITDAQLTHNIANHSFADDVNPRSFMITFNPTNDVYLLDATARSVR